MLNATNLWEHILYFTLKFKILTLSALTNNLTLLFFQMNNIFWTFLPNFSLAMIQLDAKCTLKKRKKLKNGFSFVTPESSPKKTKKLKKITAKHKWLQFAHHFKMTNERFTHLPNNRFLVNTAQISYWFSLYYYRSLRKWTVFCTLYVTDKINSSSLICVLHLIWRGCPQ